MSTNKEQKKVISKKAKKEKEKKAIEESTFGLKNKNKSKKVQQFISRVEKSVKHSGDGLERVRHNMSPATVWRRFCDTGCFLLM